MSQQSQYEHLYKKYKKKYLLLKQQGGWSIIYVGGWGGQVHQFSAFISYFFSIWDPPNETSEESLKFYTDNQMALLQYIENNNFVVECCTKLNKMKKIISVLKRHNDYEYKTLPDVLCTEFYGNNTDELRHTNRINHVNKHHNRVHHPRCYKRTVAFSMCPR